MNAEREEGPRVQGARNVIEGRLQRLHRPTTARIEVPEREARRTRPLLNDETMAGQQRVLEISREKGGGLTVLDSPVRSGGKKRDAGPRGDKPRTSRTTAGRRLGRSSDLEDVAADASARYRARYAEVLHQFRAGKLIGKSGVIVTERYEAKAIAADEARRTDARADRERTL